MYRLTVHLENVQKTDVVVGKKKNDKGKMINETKKTDLRNKSEREYLSFEKTSSVMAHHLEKENYSNDYIKAEMNDEMKIKKKERLTRD